MVRVCGSRGVLLPEGHSKKKVKKSWKKSTDAVTPDPMWFPKDITKPKLLDASKSKPLSSHQRKNMIRTQLEGNSREEKSLKRKSFQDSYIPRPRYPGQTFLEQMAISAEAATDYMIRYQGFLLFVKEKAYNLDTPKSLDSSFSFYLNHLFFEGADVSEGFKVLAAVLDAHPDCGGKQGLLQSRRCLQGWAKIDPARTRPPLPFPVVAMLAGHMIDFGCPEAALAILLMFSCYLRPSEMLSIKGVDL